MSKSAHSVAEFCASYSISKALLYKLWREGFGPAHFKLGRRTLISAEAAEAWQRSLEKINSAPCAEDGE